MSLHSAAASPSLRRHGLARALLASVGLLLPVAAGAQAPPAANGATSLLPPTRQFPASGIQSESLPPPPGVASPSLTGPQQPSVVTPNTPALPNPAAPNASSPNVITPGTVPNATQPVVSPAAPAIPPIQGTVPPASVTHPSGAMVPGAAPAAPNQAAPGQPIPGQPIPGQPIPGQPNPGQTNPGQPQAETPPPPNPWQPAGAAVVQVLNKPDAQSGTLTIKVGQSATYRSLTITVKACEVRPSDMVPDATAYLEIADSHAGQPGFSGWMLKSDPSLNMLQNPIYDVRVKGCTP